MSKIQTIQSRKYQERDFDNIVSSWESGEQIMYQLPTGGGKSVVVGKVYQKYSEERVIFIVHRRRLLFQMRDRLKSLGLNPGLVVGDVRENVDSNLLLVSIQTLARDRQFTTILAESWDKVIIDEAHRLRTPSYDKVLDQLLLVNPKLKLLGVTATPYRSDKLDYRKYCTKLIVSDDISTLIENKYLSKYRTYSINIGNVDAEVVKYDNDYQTSSLSTYMRKPQYLQALVDLYKKNGEERQTLIFAVDRKHAKSIVEVYKKNGFDKIEYIDSDVLDDEREAILKRFESKETQFVVSIETLTEGVDLPDTGCVQVARPTDSLTLYLQINGRGMRLKSDGSDLIILDCGGNTQKFGLISSPKHWSLDPSIDPKTISRKNRVVGKRKNGTYTEDKEEMKYLELVEMTPEEYLINISGNIEKAKEFNKEVEETIKNKTLSLGELILKKAKITDMVYKEDKYHPEQLLFSYKDEEKGDGYSIKIRRSGVFFTLETDKPWRVTVKEHFQESHFYYRLAEFYKVVSQKEIVTLLENHRTELKELEDSKIDIDRLNRKVKEFKEQEFFKELDSVLKSGQTEIEFSTTFPLGHHFRDLYGRTNLVRFDRERLLSSHVVSFHEKRVVTEKMAGTWEYENKKAGDIVINNNGTYNYMDRAKLLEVIFPVWETRIKQEELQAI